MKCADDVIIMIFSFLPIKELAIIPPVCKRYKNLSQQDLVWRHVAIHYLINNNYPVSVAENAASKIKNLKDLLRNSFLEKKYKIQKLAIAEEKAKQAEDEALVSQMTEFQHLAFINNDPRITEPFPTYPVSYSTSPPLQYSTMYGDSEPQKRCCFTICYEIFSCCIPLAPSDGHNEEKDPFADNNGEVEIFKKGTLEFEVNHIPSPKL